MALSAEVKKAIIDELETRVWPHVRNGEVKPLIFKTFGLAEAGAAHELMDSGKHIGKIVLLSES